MNPIYTIEIYRLNPVNGTFSRIDTIESFEKLSFSQRLNGIGACSFEIDLDSKKATNTNFTRFINQIVVKRNNNIVFFGPIVKRRGSVKNEEEKVEIECLSYIYHLATRFTSKLQIFTNTAQSTIAWNLISAVQARDNGNLGIYQGVLASGNNRDRTYEYKGIAEALIEFSNIQQGFDWEFQPIQDANGLLSSINFNTYFPQIGLKRDDLPPITMDNVASLAFVDDGEIYNQVTFEGAGTGSPILFTAGENFSQSSFGRREAIQMEKDISIQDTLNRKGNAYLNKNSVNRFKIDIELYPRVRPSFGDLNLGDVLNINLSNNTVQDSILNISKEGRIVELNVEVDGLGVEKVSPRIILY